MNESVSKALAGLLNSMKSIFHLLKVKSLVTFAVVAVYVILAMRGVIQPDFVQTVTVTVISFYFGTQHEKKSEDT